MAPLFREIENLSWPTAGGIGAIIASFLLLPNNN